MKWQNAPLPERPESYSDPEDPKVLEVEFSCVTVARFIYYSEHSREWFAFYPKGTVCGCGCIEGRFDRFDASTVVRWRETDLDWQGQKRLIPRL